MDTAQVGFEGVERGVELPEVTWPEVTSVTCPEPEVCACATGSVRNIRPSRARKWRQSRHQSRDRKMPCWEVCAGATGSCVPFSRNRKLRNRFPRFFLTVVQVPFLCFTYLYYTLF